MCKKLLFAFSILWLAILLPGQSMAQCFATINGQVTNANTQQPVANQMVYIDVANTPGTSYAGMTNPNGFYSINVGIPCSTVSAISVYTVACGDTLIQNEWAMADSTFTIPFYVCDSNVVNPNCDGSVSVTSIQQGIALSYQLPWASNVVVSFGDNPNATYFWPQQHVYADSGIYTVCVTAYGNQCVWDSCFTVTIDQFTGTDSCFVNGIVTPYGANGIEFGWNGGNGLGLAPVSVVWNFGDGNSSNNYPNGGTYQYNAPGTYTACVTITWASGCSATDCQSVTVGAAPTTFCGYAGYTIGTDTIPFTVDCGIAYLIAIDSVGQHTVVDSAALTANGFCLNGQPLVTYTILVVPCDSSLMPTYLGNVLFWQDADSYSGGGWFYINLQTGQSVQGPGVIGGTIVWGDKAVGDPIAGIRVLLLDENAAPIKYAVTDLEGYYSFGNLPYGTYRIYPEEVGMTTYPGLVILSPENPSVTSANFSLTTETFMGIEQAPVSVSGLYPNPAVDQATLSLFAKESGSGNIQIIDLAGKTVASFPVAINKGQQNVSIDVNTLKAGMYTVTLTVRGQRMHTKLIKQ